MTHGPFAQLLTVPTDGFRWEADFVPAPGFQSVEDDLTGPWLVHPAPVGAECAERQYAPLAVPGLHRRFGHLKPTQSSFQRFANQFGQLGHPAHLVAATRTGFMYEGEPFRFWVASWVRVVTLLRLWDLVQFQHRRELATYFQWQRDPPDVLISLVADADGLLPFAARRLLRDPSSPLAATYLATTHLEVLPGPAGGLASAALLAHWEPGDPIEPARYYVHRAVNEAMRGHVHPTVLPFRDGQIYFFPDCLLGAVYVQFALELSGRARPAKQCQRPSCGNYFVPSRRNQAYCEPACRRLAWHYAHRDRRGTS